MQIKKAISENRRGSIWHNLAASGDPKHSIPYWFFNYAFCRVNPIYYTLHPKL